MTLKGVKVLELPISGITEKASKCFLSWHIYQSELIKLEMPPFILPCLHVFCHTERMWYYISLRMKLLMNNVFGLVYNCRERGRPALLFVLGLFVQQQLLDALKVFGILPERLGWYPEMVEVKIEGVWCSSMGENYMLSQQEHSQLTLIMNKLLPGILEFSPWALKVKLRWNTLTLIQRGVVKKVREGILQQLFLSWNRNSSNPLIFS